MSRPASSAHSSATRVDSVLAIVVGAAQVDAAVVDRDGKRHYEANIPAPVGIGDAGAVEAIRGLVRASVAAAPRSTRLLGGSVVVPGIVDPLAGIARFTAEFGWHNLPLAALIEADLDRPVVLDHLVRAAALAEREIGPTRDAADWVYVSVGASVGAAAVIGGQVQRGATGMAGEFGHLPVFAFGTTCTCGQRGCVEAYASIPRLTGRYAEIAGRPVTLAELAARVGRDPLADDIWAQGMTALGLGLTMYTLIEDPALIVIGGELATTAPVALPALRAELRRRLAWRQPPRLVEAQAGPDAALTGAAVLAWEGLERS